MIQYLAVVAFAIFTLVAPQIGHAESRELSRVKISARIIKQQNRLLQMNAKKLKGSERTQANRALKSLLSDRDGDGSPDLLEDSFGTDACNATSDGEHRDGDKREREGSISAASESSITVGGLVFILSDTTTLEDLESGDLIVGACVSVEGFLGDGGVITATKVEAHDHCRGN